MIRRLLRRHGYWMTVCALAAGTCALGVFLLGNVVVPELAPTDVPIVASPSPTSPPASPLASSLADIAPGMGGAVPANADCGACHLTNAGVIGLRTIPAMGHPLQGWTQCTACHSTQTLVATAPGHTGIHASACLTCHKPGNLPAPLSRPHRALQNMACLDCHGTTAPLPQDMTHRSERVCWLCHRLPDVQPPVPEHATVTGETDCLACHVAGKVGALPADHATRTSSECLLCHEIPGSGTTPGSSPGSGAAGLTPPASAPDAVAGSERDDPARPLYALVGPVLSAAAAAR